MGRPHLTPITGGGSRYGFSHGSYGGIPYEKAFKATWGSPNRGYPGGVGGPMIPHGMERGPSFKACDALPAQRAYICLYPPGGNVGMR